MNRQWKYRLHRNILSWFAKHGRDLPWRETNNPYKVLVSEVMLQQTQVGRVLEKYPQFLKRFPTLSSLASASTRDAIRSWSGMGYNNRIVRLQNLARQVIEHYHRTFPRTIDALRQLPGIGQYTAHAVACYAFRQNVPLVDTNIRRVISRIFGKVFPINHKDEKAIWTVANSLLPKGKTYAWNQALMDLGAMICTARQPKCAQCPVNTLCRSAFQFSARSNRHPAKGGTKAEPSHDGIPRRVYRGRIVEILRNHRRGVRTN